MQKPVNNAGRKRGYVKYCKKNAKIKPENVLSQSSELKKKDSYTWATKKMYIYGEQVPTISSAYMNNNKYTNTNQKSR